MFEPERKIREEGIARLPRAVAMNEIGERENREVVEVKFTIGIGENAGNFVEDLARAAGVWANEKAAAVVVVGVKVIPQKRFSAQERADFADMPDGDFFGDDFGTGPKDVDLGSEFASENGEIIGAA